MATIWTMPDGSQVIEETQPECPACHHEHSPLMGGICIGCLCEAFPQDAPSEELQRQVEAPSPVPATAQSKEGT